MITMTIEKTDKSSAIRIRVNPIYFEKGFENAVSDVEQALRAIRIFIDFANNL